MVGARGTGASIMMTGNDEIRFRRRRSIVDRAEAIPRVEMSSKFN